MRLKVKRLLKDGQYLVFFKTESLSREEVKKMKKLPLPGVDLTAFGLGTRQLDQMDFCITCRSAEEANRIAEHVKGRISSKLTELSARRTTMTGGPVARIILRRRSWAVGLASVLVILLAIAFQGVICSQQTGNRITQFLGASHAKGKATGGGKVALFSGNQSSRGSLGATADRGLNEAGSSNAYGRNSSGEAVSSAALPIQPDFTVSAVPETLVRYSDWRPNSRQSGGEDRSSGENIKLILTAVEGFQGPVELSVSGSCYRLDMHLYPTQIRTLPGSATLVIPLSPTTPFQICSTLTVVARGIAPSGNLITHEKKLVLVLRQKPSYLGRVWHVSMGGNDLSGDGSPESPFATIQKGISRAATGDTVLVEKGLYRENINLINKDNLTVTSRFILDQQESTTKSTIIEGREPGWVVTIDRSRQVTLSGFTIQKGRGNGDLHGGGICCYGSSPKILDNVVTENQTRSGFGVGIYCYDSNPSIQHNQITENRNYRGHGAGIYCYQSDPDIQDNLISGNYSSGGGSGIHLLEGDSAFIARNLIYADSGSSAVLLYSSSTSGNFRVVGNTIGENHADAIRCFGGSWYLKNNIIAQNDGYGLFTLNGIAYLTYNDIWANVSGKDTLNCCGLTENPAGRNGNISMDPHFGNPQHGNFHLSFNSPCIDLGDPNDLVVPKGNLRVDMGAFEYTHPDPIAGDINRDGFVDYGDVVYLRDFLRQRGSSLEPLQIGDVNCDGKIDQQDISYLYGFLYYYGPQPCSSPGQKAIVIGR
ncbi:MAG: DUF1565 domain-containing protein [Candidatus Zixiibacteriota bacterium]